MCKRWDWGVNGDFDFFFVRGGCIGKRGIGFLNVGVLVIFLGVCSSVWSVCGFYGGCLVRICG